MKLKAIIGMVLAILLTTALVSTEILSLGRSGYVRVQGGSTEVCGFISKDTTWTSANSPYIVTCDVTLLNSSTLTIDPGVTVKFADSKSLVITSGCSLIAQGTNMNKIRFTSNKTEPKAGDWENVWFLGKDFVMSYALIEYATTGVKLETTADMSNSTISNCNVGIKGKLSNAYNLTVVDNSGDGLSVSGLLAIKDSNVSSNGGHGITVTGGSIDMDNCVVSNNTGNGVVLSNGGDIKNSRIIGNGGNGTCILGTKTTIRKTAISANGGDGVWTESDVSIDGCNITGNEKNGIRSEYIDGPIMIENSNISRNSNDGIWTNSSVRIERCDIDYNEGNGVITAEDVNMTVKRSNIRNNTMNGLSGRGYVENSTVSDNNGTGILGSFEVKLFSSIIRNHGGGFKGTGRIHWSNIFNNTLWGSYDAIADVWPNNITATENCWGTQNPTEIEEHIWDHNDNESLGYVFYDNWKQCPIPPEDKIAPEISVPTPAYRGTSPPIYIAWKDFKYYPDYVRVNEPISVWVNVTDNGSPDPSGVDKVILSYVVNWGGPRWNTTMNLETWYTENLSGNWSAIIPGQPGYSNVSFVITAYDNNGNSYTTRAYTCLVKWLPVGDMNGDCVTNMKDIYQSIRNFGEEV